jgi:hypothetical protein
MTFQSMFAKRLFERSMSFLLNRVSLNALMVLLPFNGGSFRKHSGHSILVLIPATAFPGGFNHEYH